MAYIRHIPPSQAGGRLAHVYSVIRKEVPRVPNLMQVFSLRPETMEWLYRSWISCMWNGSIRRADKELLAVVVSKAARSEYCADAHMVFMQAAGVDRNRAFELEERLGDCDSLDPAMRVAARFASKITKNPRSVTNADRAELARAWPEPGDLAQICAVIGSFNCIARVANALGVHPEIPVGLRGFELGRRSAIALLSRLTLMSVDFGEKPVSADTPEENHRALEHLFVAQLGFPDTPPQFRLLKETPDIANGHLRLIEKSFVVVPRDRWMRIGLVVGRLAGCEYFAANCAAWLAERRVEAADVIAASEGVQTSLPEAEGCCLRFARDLTLYSHKIGKDRIQELRAVGLSDGAILDLAFVAGVFNAMTRFALCIGDHKVQGSGSYASGARAAAALSTIGTGLKKRSESG